MKYTTTSDTQPLTIEMRRGDQFVSAEIESDADLRDSSYSLNLINSLSQGIRVTVLACLDHFRTSPAGASAHGPFFSATRKTTPARPTGSANVPAAPEPR